MTPALRHRADFDPTTRICTFTPVDRRTNGVFGFPMSLFTDRTNGRIPVGCDSLPPVFQLVSSHWFRPALDGQNSFFGLQLAARPELHPSRHPVFWPKAAEQRGEVFIDREHRCTNGWVVCA